MSLVIEIADLPRNDCSFETGVWKKQFFTAMFRKDIYHQFLPDRLILHDRSAVTAEQPP